MTIAKLPEPFQEPRGGRHHAHVAGHGLDDDHRDLAPARGHQPLDGAEVVEGRGQRHPGQGFRHAQAVGHAEGRAARARLD